MLSQSFLFMGKKSVNTELLWKIAARIKELREERNLTQEAFYHDTGIHIGRIERAKRDVSATTLARICTYFQIDLTTFFQGIDS